MKHILLAALCVLTAQLAAGQVVRASSLAKPLQVPKPQAAARRGMGPEYGSVRRVLDGDTYEVRLPAGLVRVRLREADAPELSQPFGQQAADSVMKLLRGRILQVDRGGVDRYGRTLAGLRVAVQASSGANRWLSVDSLLVVRGWAWAYEPDQTVPALAELQQQAQRSLRGLWRCGVATPIRPGLWRAYNKQEKARAWVGCPGRRRE
ncbi:thermonuclease family protein [Hymenobacter sp. 5414T-23]|uniref:thermonuclease family protein n=1 Tax=Hymenobacter sp. 5414T-23 TaxID=2932252 RepID=UPI001FD5B78D|nr:thermonuclease family protein [Hymenobacter sp. 5414T-23]UOQ81017.1 thermonuclease family protein [Hymenobacter sp. 5414T-23]